MGRNFRPDGCLRVMSVIALLVGSAALILLITVNSRTSTIESDVSDIHSSINTQGGMIQGALSVIRGKIDNLAETLGWVKTTTHSIDEKMNEVRNTMDTVNEKVMAIQPCVNGDQHIGMDTIRVLRDAPDLYVGGNGYSMPPDTISAVGDHSIVSMSNKGWMIIDKETFMTIDSGSDQILDPFTRGDPHIVWDQDSKRFYFTQFSSICGANIEVVVDGIPNSIFARNTGDGDNVRVTTSLSGSIVETVPQEACSAVTNAGAISGNIALVKRGSCAFTDKVLNAQAAGAIAVLIYDNVPASKCAPLSPFIDDASITIPAFMVGNIDGEAIVAALPTTLTSTTVLPEGDGLFYSEIGVAASKTANPQSITSADWEYFVIADPIYSKSEFADYCKIAVDANRIYITTQNFEANNTRQQILAIDKSDVADGIGVTVSFNKYIEPRGTIFPYPAENKPPAANGLYPRQYFLSYNGNADAPEFTPDPIFPDSVRIMRTHPYIPGGPLEITDIPFGEGLPMLMSLSQAAEQPRTTSDGEESQSIPAFALPKTGVRRGNSLWFAHTYQSVSMGTDDDADGPYNENFNITFSPRPGRSVVRWYEFDISRDTFEGIIKLVQFGDILPQDGESGLSMPHINVDVEGNMAIGFTISGPHQLPSTAYTGRHHSDPLGTTRYPIIIAVPGVVPFDPTEVFGPGRMRWGDYSKMDVDPTDGRTFYVHGMTPHTDSFDWNAAQDASVTWSTEIATFKIERLDHAPKIQTTPRRTIGSSVEAEVRFAPRPGFSEHQLKQFFKGVKNPQKKAKPDPKAKEEVEEASELVPFGPRCHAKEVNGEMSDRCKFLEFKLGTDVFMKGPMFLRKDR